MVFDLQRLRRSFLGVSGLFMLGIPLSILANIILARTLSVAEFGTFGFVIALATVLTIPVSGGLPMLLTREVAGYVRLKLWSDYRGLVVSAYRWIAWLSFLIGMGYLCWSALSNRIPNTQILIAFLLVPFLGLNGVRNGILKGLGRPVMAEAPTQIMQPILMILGYLALAGLGLSSATNVLWWYFAAVVAVFILASAILWWVQPDGVHNTTSDLRDLPRWRKAILPFAMMSAVTVLSTQIAVLLLGFFGQDEAVAQMRVAERGAQLVVLPLILLQTIIGPYFVQVADTGDRSELRQIARHSARLAMVASLPVAVMLLTFGRSLIGWTFGAPYDTEAYLPMVILISAQLLSVTLGDGGYMLAMRGHEKQTLYSMLLYVGVTITLCVLLITPLGVVGAAIAAASGIVAAKLYVYTIVWRRFSFSSGIL